MDSNDDIRVIGVMVGSSMDGIDLALCRFCPDGTYHWEDHTTRPLSRTWEENLRGFKNLDPSEAFSLDMAFGLYLGEIIREWLRGRRADLIGVHGYTVAHDPAKLISRQLGEGRAIFHITGIPVVDDFRQQDILSGGSGAPLAPVVERDLFPRQGIFVNLGGISNASIHSSRGEVVARDLTGCNQIANALAEEAGESMDRDGMLSAGGNPIPGLAETAARIRRERREAISISNEWVKECMLPVFQCKNYPLADRLVTLYEHQADSLMDFLGKNMGLARSQECLFTGGGAHNPELMLRFQKKLTPAGYTICPAPEHWIDFKESLLIAWLAYLHALKWPTGAWVWTGAIRDDVAGTAYGL